MLSFLVPVLVTFIALATIHLVEPGRAKRKILLWCPAVALLALCVYAGDLLLRHRSICRLRSLFLLRPSPTPGVEPPSSGQCIARRSRTTLRRDPEIAVQDGGLARTGFGLTTASHRRNIPSFP